MDHHGAHLGTIHPPPHLGTNHTPHKNGNISKPIAATNRKSVDIYANLERINEAKRVAEKAARERKVYRLDGGHRYLRKALKKRGWVEKFTPKTKKFHVGDDDDVNVDDDINDNNNNSDDQNDGTVATNGSQPKEEAHLPLDDFDIIVSRALRDFEPQLAWMPTSRINFKHLNKNILLNHFPRALFTTKTGLTSSLKNLVWLADSCCDDFYPRCYILGDPDDNDAFQEDFRRCAVSSFLKICQIQMDPTKTVETPPTQNISSESAKETSTPNSAERGDVGGDSMEETNQTSSHSPHSPLQMRPLPKYISSKWIEFALEMNKRFTNQCTSTTSTICRQKGPNYEDQIITKEWERFLSNYYLIAHKGHLVSDVSTYAHDISLALSHIEKTNSQFDIEGHKNLWIVKPGAMSRGRGISVQSNLASINDLIGPDLNVVCQNRWVAQKYIERPFLIHNVKFDIRQWFLITDWGTLTIWMYKKSYIRFSSQNYTLNNLADSIHLTNNAIQRKLEIAEDRHGDLPEENMWYSDDFDDYLRYIGYGKAWEKKIYPRMREILTCTCQAGADTAEPRKNSFELYGADFMLDDKLNPYLIEINSGPTMSISTQVTRTLVESLMEDICKVVLDPRERNRNPNYSNRYPPPDTGGFELIYRAQPVDYPSYTGNHISVDGTAILKPGKPKTRTIIKIHNTTLRIENSGFGTNKRKNEASGSTNTSLSSTDDVDGGNGGDGGSSGDHENDDAAEKRKSEYRSYSWDVDRINQLAQPRSRSDHGQRNSGDKEGQPQKNEKPSSRSATKATLLATEHKTGNLDNPYHAGKPRHHHPKRIMHPHAVRNRKTTTAARDTVLSTTKNQHITSTANNIIKKLRDAAQNVQNQTYQNNKILENDKSICNENVYQKKSAKDALSERGQKSWANRSCERQRSITEDSRIIVHRQPEPGKPRQSKSRQDLEVARKRWESAIKDRIQMRKEISASGYGAPGYPGGAPSSGISNGSSGAGNLSGGGHGSGSHSPPLSTSLGATYCTDAGGVYPIPNTISPFNKMTNTINRYRIPRSSTTHNIHRISSTKALKIGGRNCEISVTSQNGKLGKQKGKFPNLDSATAGMGSVVTASNSYEQHQNRIKRVSIAPTVYPFKCLSVIYSAKGDDPLPVVMPLKSVLGGNLAPKHPRTGFVSSTRNSPPNGEMLGESKGHTFRVKIPL